MTGRENRDAESKRMAEVWERCRLPDWEVGGDGDMPLLRGLSAQLSAVEGGSGYQVSLS